MSTVSLVSTDGEVGAKALIQGIGGGYIPVPLSRVVLKSRLVLPAAKCFCISSHWWKARIPWICR